MEPPSVPPDEDERLEVLEEYGVMDTSPEQTYDDIVRIAAHVTEAPTAMLSLIDRDRQWVKAKHGVGEKQIQRNVSFCAHQVTGPDELMIVEDATEDPRFEDNPFVQNEPKIRFYAGRPLVTPEGHVLGSLCVFDYEARSLSDEAQSLLEALGRQAMVNLELRRRRAQMVEQLDGLNQHLDALGIDRVQPVGALGGASDPGLSRI